MAEDDPKIKITKLDAARRQLRIPIRLWFDDDDPIAIHTLTAAAHDIIHTLFRRKGLKNLLFDSKLIKDNFRAEWVRGMKATQTSSNMPTGMQLAPSNLIRLRTKCSYFSQQPLLKRWGNHWVLKRTP